MKKEIALIWMSAGNSYFNEENIGKLLNFADKNFEKILLLSPTKPAEHTFRALGYKENKLKRKAKLNANLLMNRAKRKLKKIKNKKKFLLVDWEKNIENNSEYKKKYKEIANLYLKNKKFRIDARKTTEKVIGKLIKIKDKEKLIDEAILYLIEELSFILASLKIYNAKKIVYLYHTDWEIYKNLISGKYDGIKKENLGFKLTRIN